MLLHSQENDGSGISFSNDGKKMFITGHAQNKIHQWDLDDAFDPSTKINLVSLSLNWNGADRSGDANYSNDQGDWLRGHTWNKDGSKLFVVNWDGGVAGDATASYRICSYDASTPFEVSSINSCCPNVKHKFRYWITASLRSLAASSEKTKISFT